MCVDTVVTCTLSQPNEEITIIIDPASRPSLSTPAFPTTPVPCYPPSLSTPAFPVPAFEPITPVAAPRTTDSTPAFPVPAFEPITPVAAPRTTDTSCQTDTTLEDQRWKFAMANIQALQHQIIALQNYVLNQ